MGCCDSKEKNGSYLVTAPRKREFILRNVDPRVTKDHFDRIIQFLEIDEALKLLKLNKKIRTLLPEYVKLNHMVKKLNSNKDNELDLNSLISDISK